MKQFEIRITGSGTKNQIEIALLHVVRELQTTADTDICKDDKVETWEDPTILTEITPN